MAPSTYHDADDDPGWDRAPATRPRSLAMRILHALLALSIVATPLAWASTQDGDHPERAPEVVDAKAEESASPMQAWARMAGGEWRVTYPDGQKLVQTWNWGPGQHSMRILSYRPDSLVEPPNGVHLLYWHPGRQEFVLKGLLANQRHMDGVMKIDGDQVELTFQFHTDSDTLQMSERWTFDGADKFHETMYAHTDAGVSPVRESDYVRSKELSPIAARTAKNAVQPSKALHGLSALVGHSWEAKAEGDAGNSFAAETDFAWVPGSDAIYAHAYKPATETEERSLQLDAYFYAHPRSKTLHYLALTTWGGVFEGDLRELPEGGIELIQKGFEGDQVTEYVERLDFQKDGRLRDRVWRMKDGKLEPLLDILHSKIQAD